MEFRKFDYKSFEDFQKEAESIGLSLPFPKT